MSQLLAVAHHALQAQTTLVKESAQADFWAAMLMVDKSVLAPGDSILGIVRRALVFSSVALTGSLVAVRTPTCAASFIITI